MPPRAGGGGGWAAVGKLDGRDAEDSAAVDAVLNLAINADSPPEPAKVLHALRVAQSALRGERARSKRAASSSAAADAQNEVAALKEKLRLTEDELKEAREEIGDLADELAVLERKERAGTLGGGRERGGDAGVAAATRGRIEELETEVPRAGPPIRSRPHSLRTQSTRGLCLARRPSPPRPG